MTFWNDGTFTWTSSVQGLPVILKPHNLPRLDKALDLFIEFKFCEGHFYFLNGSKNCMVATYNFGSVYISYVYSHPPTLLWILVISYMKDEPISTSVMSENISCS